MFFFFNDTATTEIYTLSLHDAFRSLAGNDTHTNTTMATTSGAEGLWVGSSNVAVMICTGLAWLGLF